MNVARLNGSHSDLDWHRDTIALLRDVAIEVPILLDIPGRKIRIKPMEKDLDLATEELVVISPNPEANGRATVAVTYAGLYEDLSPGDQILAQEGILRLRVVEVVGENVICRALSPGTLQGGAGIHVVDVPLRRELLSDRDKELINFAGENEVDFVGASFIETANDVEFVRSLTTRHPHPPRIISKVETQGALEHLAELIETSDALMIDRGDLSMQTGYENLALLQKRIIAEAQRKACPVIVATEVLHSMTLNPMPTKAELTDITNSVLDGAAALMLSGETAIGEFPIESVETMRSVADAASAAMDESFSNFFANSVSPSSESVPEVMGEAIALICRNLPITKIVAVTITGYAARSVSAKLLRQPILAVSNDAAAARSLNLLRGTTGHFVDIPYSATSMDHVPYCMEELWRSGELVDEDMILIAALSYPKSGNRMNLIETHKVSDLRDSLGWTK
jgi:pyruvate kinase